MSRKVLVVGGSFSGLCVARDLRADFLVTIVDAKEFFEYTPGILRAYVKPAHFDALSFTLAPTIEKKMQCKFIWGEVLKLDGDEKTALIKPMFTDKNEKVGFDYCMICAGCNFGMFHKWGESLWFPTIHGAARPEGSWPHIDERFIEGRRRHILEEYAFIKQMNDKSQQVLIAGAGFIGVEWATELEYFFPKLKLTIIDFLPKCLGPLPDKAAVYCSNYMKKVGIKEFYKTKYEPDSDAFWKAIELPMGKSGVHVYVCMGVKASNFFMPDECLSVKPGPVGWIPIDMNLGVVTNDQKDPKPWGRDAAGFPRIFAIGDCNYGCVMAEGKPVDEWPIPPIPKISYPGEEQAIIACANVHRIDKIVYDKKTVNCWGDDIKMWKQHWPWGAGMFATSLGPRDACFVAGASHKKNSGWMVLWGAASAVQKEIIEASKTDECRFGPVGRIIWHFVHHTPVHLWGNGPKYGYGVTMKF